MIIVQSQHSPYLREMHPVIKSLTLYGINTCAPVLLPDHTTEILEILIPLTDSPAFKTLTTALKGIKTPLNLVVHEGRICVRLEGTR